MNSVSQTTVSRRRSQRPWASVGACRICAEHCQACCCLSGLHCFRPANGHDPVGNQTRLTGRTVRTPAVIPLESSGRPGCPKRQRPKVGTVPIIIPCHRNWIGMGEDSRQLCVTLSGFINRLQPCTPPNYLKGELICRG